MEGIFLIICVWFIFYDGREGEGMVAKLILNSIFASLAPNWRDLEEKFIKFN
jgi:hypothetical protein